MAYNMYPNNQFYLQDLQNMKDRIDVQMRQIQQNQAQQVQPKVAQAEKENYHNLKQMMNKF